MRTILAALAFSLFSVPAAYATDYFVDYVSGADTNSGTSCTLGSAPPWTGCAWQHMPGDSRFSHGGFAGLNPGDTVHLAPKVVYSQTPGIHVTWSGSSGSPVTYDGGGLAADGTYGDAIVDGFVTQSATFAATSTPGVSTATLGTTVTMGLSNFLVIDSEPIRPTSNTTSSDPHLPDIAGHPVSYYTNLYVTNSGTSTTGVAATAPSTSSTTFTLTGNPSNTAIAAWYAWDGANYLGKVLSYNSSTHVVTMGTNTPAINSFANGTIGDTITFYDGAVNTATWVLDDATLASIITGQTVGQQAVMVLKMYQTDANNVASFVAPTVSGTKVSFTGTFLAGSFLNGYYLIYNAISTIPQLTYYKSYAWQGQQIWAPVTAGAHTVGVAKAIYAFSLAGSPAANYVSIKHMMIRGFAGFAWNPSGAINLHSVGNVFTENVVDQMSTTPGLGGAAVSMVYADTCDLSNNYFGPDIANLSGINFGGGDHCTIINNTIMDPVWDGMTSSDETYLTFKYNRIYRAGGVHSDGFYYWHTNGNHVLASGAWLIGDTTINVTGTLSGTAKAGDIVYDNGTVQATVGTLATDYHNGDPTVSLTSGALVASSGSSDTLYFYRSEPGNVFAYNYVFEANACMAIEGQVKPNTPVVDGILFYGNVTEGCVGPGFIDHGDSNGYEVYGNLYLCDSPTCDNSGQAYGSAVVAGLISLNVNLHDNLISGFDYYLSPTLGVPQTTTLFYNNNTALHTNAWGIPSAAGPPSFTASGNQYDTSSPTATAVTNMLASPGTKVPAAVQQYVAPNGGHGQLGPDWSY